MPVAHCISSFVKPENNSCYLKDKSEPLLIDLKDKSELLWRGAKLGTVFLMSR